MPLIYLSRSFLLSEDRLGAIEGWGTMIEEVRVFEGTLVGDPKSLDSHSVVHQKDLKLGIWSDEGEWRVEWGWSNSVGPSDQGGQAELHFPPPSPPPLSSPVGP